MLNICRCSVYKAKWHQPGFYLGILSQSRSVCVISVSGATRNGPRSSQGRVQDGNMPPLTWSVKLKFLVLYEGKILVLSPAAPPLHLGEHLATVANILGQDDVSFWNVGIPIRLQIAQSTAYLTWGCHVFQSLT